MNNRLFPFLLFLLLVSLFNSCSKCSDGINPDNTVSAEINGVPWVSDRVEALLSFRPLEDNVLLFITAVATDSTAFTFYLQDLDQSSLDCVDTEEYRNLFNAQYKLLRISYFLAPGAVSDEAGADDSFVEICKCSKKSQTVSGRFDAVLINSTTSPPDTVRITNGFINNVRFEK